MMSEEYQANFEARILLAVMYRLDVGVCGETAHDPYILRLVLEAAIKQIGKPSDETVPALRAYEAEGRRLVKARRVALGL
jgi:hypothetical protein